MSTSKPRIARPCAICQKTRVEKTKVCEECMIKFKDQVGKPWFQYAIEESDNTARLIRNARRHEEQGDGALIKADYKNSRSKDSGIMLEGNQK